MNPQILQSIASAYSDIVEAFTLSKGHHVYHDDGSQEFAKHYVKGHKGEHTLKPSAQQEKDSEDFANTYDTKHVRTGFGGSGTSVYTHKQTGEKFQVNRVANGKGFDGTDHNITKIG